jgi:hypothetical protein
MSTVRSGTSDSSHISVAAVLGIAVLLVLFVLLVA